MANKHSFEVIEGSARCPAEQVLASYADGSLQPVQRDAVSRHMAGCDRCLETVGFLARTGTTAAPAKSRMHWYRWGSIAAAGLIVAAGVTITQAPPHDPPSPGPPQTAPSSVRSGVEAPSLAVLEPADHAVVAAAPLNVRWSAVAGATAYDIRVHDREGSVLWQTRSTSDSVQVPAAELAGRRDLYVSVIAQLEDGKTVRSPFTGFSVAVP